MSINLSARWQAAKKEGRFGDFEFVGVRVYVRVQNRQKQVTELFLKEVIDIILRNKRKKPLTINNNISAVGRLFRRPVRHQVIPMTLITSQKKPLLSTKAKGFFSCVLGKNMGKTGIFGLSDG